MRGIAYLPNKELYEKTANHGSIAILEEKYALEIDYGTRPLNLKTNLLFWSTSDREIGSILLKKMLKKDLKVIKTTLFLMMHRIQKKKNVWNNENVNQV